MPVKSILQIGDPLLKAKTKEVQSDQFGTEELNSLLTDLKDTILHSRLIGLASTQIGSNLRVFITQPRQNEVHNGDASQQDKLRIYINPEIIELSQEESLFYEGCGSVLEGQLFGPVTRPKWVRIRAKDENGKRFELRTDGILARVIQHEYDHLQGIEFTEKLADPSKLLAREHYISQIKNQEWHERNASINILEYRQL